MELANGLTNLTTWGSGSVSCQQSRPCYNSQRKGVNGSASLG